MTTPISRVRFDRQGFVKLNGVLLSEQYDELGRPYLRGSLWQLTERRNGRDHLVRADELLPVAKVLEPLDGVFGRAGWTIRVELDDAEELLARQLPVPLFN